MGQGHRVRELKRIADLAQRVEAELAEDTPEQLKRSPALRVLYNDLKGDGGTSNAGGSC